MKLKILIAFYILIIVSSCLDDSLQNDFSCETEGRFLGDFPLTTKTDSLLPYIAGKSLIFVDSLGNEIIFVETEPINETIEEKRVRTVCGSSQLDIHEFDYFIEHQKRARYYCSETTTNIYINAYKSYFEITDTSFIPYDYFSLSAGSNYMQLGYMDDGSDISIFSPFLTEKLVTEAIGDTILLDRSFTNVFRSKFDINPIYYSKTIGLAAFRSYDNVFWVFDRAE